MIRIATYAAGISGLLLLSACAGNAPEADQGISQALAASTTSQETSGTKGAAKEAPDAGSEKPAAEQELAQRSRGRTDTDGKTYRCTRTATTGTHMRKRRCRTTEQIEQDRHNADKVIDDARIGGTDVIRD